MEKLRRDLPIRTGHRGAGAQASCSLGPTISPLLLPRGTGYQAAFLLISTGNSPAPPPGHAQPSKFLHLPRCTFPAHTTGASQASGPPQPRPLWPKSGINRWRQGEAGEGRGSGGGEGGGGGWGRQGAVSGSLASLSRRSECHLQRQTPRRAFRLGLLKPSVHTDHWLEHPPASFWGMLAFLHTLTKGDPFIERGCQRGGQPAEAPSLRSRRDASLHRAFRELIFSSCSCYAL